MEKKPIVMVVKDANDAAKKLNELVEKGYYSFDFGISEEYSITVSKHSDGSTSETKEKRYRFTGMAEAYTGEELDSLNAVRDDMRHLKSERDEMNRTLNVLNKPAFAPLSILLLGVGIITLLLGVLTLVGVLPLPAGQIPIAVVLTVVGVLALGGSFAAFFLRRKKKIELTAKKDEILKSDEELKAKEKELDSRVPQWYKDAMWKAEGNTFYNASQRHTLKK